MDEPQHEDEGEFTVLLVEDNPGDARYIREMLHEVDEFAERASATAGTAALERPATDVHDSLTLVHETRLEDALDRLDAADVDVVLLDLNLPDSEGLNTLEAVRNHADEVPVVVLTGVSDRETGMDALRLGAEEFLVKDEINSSLLIRSVWHAVERRRHESQIRRQRDQLLSLSEINELVQDITRLVIDQSTREEIESVVCQSLADSDSYLFAWIGEVDFDRGVVTMRTEAGVDGYLDDVSIHIDDTERGQGPTGRAVRNEEVQVVQEAPNDPQYEPWRDQADRHGVRSSAAIPIIHENTLYAVLNVYSDRPDAFEADERVVVGRLGKIVGHAINAIERKRALMSEDVVELRFQIDNLFDTLDLSSPTDGTVSFERAVQVSDDVFLEYGTVTGDGDEALQALVDRLPHFDSLTIRDVGDDERRFELRLLESPVMSTVAARGGQVVSAIIADGTYTMTIHVPPSTGVDRVAEAVRAEYPNAKVIAKRNTTRSKPTTRLDASPVEDLTERQLGALEAAYYSGFFEWPRDANGEDVAESIGVNPATFHQHIRIAERKILDSLLDADEWGE